MTPDPLPPSALPTSLGRIAWLLVPLVLAMSWSSHAAAPTLTLTGSSVNENQPANTVVGTLGSDATNRTFALVSGVGSTDNGKFAISGSSLVTVNTFNYEAVPTQTSFSVRVRVTNTGDSSTTEQFFTITLGDVNEAPSFGLSELTNPPASLPINEHSTGTVATFNAGDIDAVPSVVYSIASGNTGGAFSINSTTGVLSVANPALVDYETVSGHTFNLVIRASDAGNAALYEARNLEIPLTNVNPSIATNTFSVFSGTPAGTVIGNIEANNVDGGTLTYAFVSLTVNGSTVSGQSFSVDSSTGAVSFAVDAATLFPNADPDNPPQASVRVRVTATGTGWTDTGTGDINLNLQLLAGGSPVLVDVLTGTGIEPDSKAAPSRGDPVQSVTTGPNGEIIVLGMSSNQSFLKIYPSNIADPVTVNLEAGFIPSSVVADENGIYVGGQMGYNAIDLDANLVGYPPNSEPTSISAKPAKVYKYSLEGLPALNTYPFGGGRDSMITDMTVANGQVYVCGAIRHGAVGSLNPYPLTYMPIWLRLATTNFSSMGPGSLDPNLPGNKTGGFFGWGDGSAQDTRCYYGTYTAITVDPNGKVILGGYILSTPNVRSTHLQWGNGFLVRFEPSEVDGSYSNDSAANKWLADGAVPQGTWPIDGVSQYAFHFINDLKLVDTGTEFKLFALMSYRDNNLSLPPGDGVSDATALTSMSLKIAKIDPYFATNVSTSAGKAYVKGSAITDIYNTAGNIIVNESRAGSLAADASGNVYVTGSIPSGAVKFGSRDVSRPNPRFFVAKYGNDLGDPEWIKLLDEGSYKPEFKPAPGYQGAAALAFPSTPGNPSFGPMLGVWNSKWNGLVLAGTYVSGDLTLRNSKSVNAISVASGKKSGFVTLVSGAGDFVGGSGLVIESATETDGRTVGNSDLILPYLGAKPATAGTTYTVEAPKIIYIDANGNPLGTFASPPSESVIDAQAVTRYVNTGLTVGKTLVGADSTQAFTSASNRYTFTFESDTRVTFHWAVEHRLRVHSDVVADLGLNSTSTALGNPDPPVSDIWVPENKPTTAFIDGVANDPNLYGARARVVGFEASGSATQHLGAPGTGGVYAFATVQDRQQVPQWVMTGPAEITYRWMQQYHVMVSATVQVAANLPEVRLNPTTALTPIDPGYGSGEHWYDAGTHVYIGSKNGGDVTSSKVLKGWKNATVAVNGKAGFSRAEDAKEALSRVPAVGTANYYYQDVLSLNAPVTVLWDYGQIIHKEIVAIGSAATFLTDPLLSTTAVVAGLTTTEAATVASQAPDRRTVVSGPQGSSGEQMAIWDPHAKMLFPLRPGKLLLEYGDQDEPLIVQLEIGFPGETRDGTTFPIPTGFSYYNHLTHPEMPGIGLDPSTTDEVALLQLAYSSGNGTVSAGGFTATQDGKTVLVYSVRDAGDPGAANGDPLREHLIVRVVDTRQWDASALPPATTAVIGTKLTHTIAPPIGDAYQTDAGFVVHKKARYNANVYDRSKTAGAGPIIPVNQHFTGQAEDDLIVIWFAKADPETHVAWTNSVEKFDLVWPTVPGRIVIASRLGSESKAPDGVMDQLSFTANAYQNVVIYNQPDRDLAGFNPNEEHALIAPSFKFADQANPPPAAYALQSGGMNVTAQDETYTSDPYVLVQYNDLQAGESKMAVYAVQLEDHMASLNPEVDARTGRKFNYTFDYTMTVAEPVQPPYPLAKVIGLVPCPETFGLNTSLAKVYWEDYNGVAYAAGQGRFNSYYHYRLTPEFWGGEGDAAVSPGTCVPFGTAASAGASASLQIVGAIDQSRASSKAFDGTTDNPVFRTLFTAPSGYANPTFTVTNPAIRAYSYSGSYELDDTPLSIEIKVGSDAPVEVTFGTQTTSATHDTTFTASLQDLVTAINDEAALASKVIARATASNLLQLESLTGEAITLSDGHGSPLNTTGFVAGTLVPDQLTFSVTLNAGTPDQIGPSKLSFRPNTPRDALADLATLRRIVLEAFPEGEVSTALIDGTNPAFDTRLRFLIDAANDLTLRDGDGTPLKSAGIGAGTDQDFSPDPATPPTIAAGFQSGSKFSLDFGSGPIEITVNGTTFQDFIDSINNDARVNAKVHASLTLEGRIRLTASLLSSLIIKEVLGTPLANAGFSEGESYAATAVRYTALWPSNPPVLKAGETLTFAGGEHRADHPEDPGLPGVIGWAVGELIFDSMNPERPSTVTGTGAEPQDYSARLIAPLETRRISIGTDEEAATIVGIIQPSTGITSAVGSVWKFNHLPASLARRFFFDPLNKQLGMNGRVNDRTLGDSDLTATPPPLYVLEPDIITSAERDELLAIPELASIPAWNAAVLGLYKLCRDPNQLSGDVDLATTPYYVGLQRAYLRDVTTGEIQFYTADGIIDVTTGADATAATPAEFQRTVKAGDPKLDPNRAADGKMYGPGLALVPGPAFLDPDKPWAAEGYVTLVENNDKAIGGPVTLRVVKVSRQERYRGAIKTILSDNVFSDQLTLRHSGDFGGNADDIVYQWYYREEDGTETALPPGLPWSLFADASNNEPRGLGQYQIELKGNPILLLADQLFFARYRHKNEAPAGGSNSTNWAGTQWEEYGAEWAGAANSSPNEPQPQLAQGWVKRVLDRINPYEARFDDFRSNSSPATYSSMIQEAGQGYVGDVALNPNKDVVENVGLIELYQTVLNRGESLSIGLSSPVVTPGINNALLLAATRITDLYLLLGNEAYSDAQDPTIGFGSTSADYGTAAPSIFSFQNQQPSLLDEELALLRGVSQSYGRPVFNRMFWNFTKSEGEVAYAMNYHLTDINRDGFIDENDARVLFPQGHGDAWGHYLSAIKSQYNLLRNPYFNWVSRSEFYNLLDVVIAVDFLDERKFADAAAARAKAGAEIVNLTYRSRYVEDPDGQWQGYTDTNVDRAWGVDGWARRAGQGAYFDWITANALLPAEDPNPAHSGIQKVDRTTVTAIHSVAVQLGKIQATQDDANSGVNPLGLAPDAVPFDFDPALAAPGDLTKTHFEQMLARADLALANAVKVFDSANLQANRLRMQATTTATFSQQTYQQDRDYRNRLIEVFGTPYEGQIGTGKAYPAGYNGPDIGLYMYVDVNDLGDATVPAPSGAFEAAWASFPQMVAVDPNTLKVGLESVERTAQFSEVVSQYFMGDILNPPTVDSPGLNNQNISPIFDASTRETAWDLFTSTEYYFHSTSLSLDLPVALTGYTFQAPASWGRRSVPGELQLAVSDVVQAEANLGSSIGDYDGLVIDILNTAEMIKAQHGVDSSKILVRSKLQSVTTTLSSVNLGLKTVAKVLDALKRTQEKTIDSITGALPDVNGLSNDVTFAVNSAVKTTGLISDSVNTGLQIAAELAQGAIDIEKEVLSGDVDLVLERQDMALGLRQKLKELEGKLWNEAATRVEVFRRLQVLRQASDRYRALLGKGQALISERTDFNRNAAGMAQQLRYQDMAFRVFRNDALQKYRASFDLAARYAYLAAKAYDYETNLSPNDPGSAQPVLQDIVRARTLGVYSGGPTHAASGLSDALATLRDNYSVLKGRLGLNNPQLDATGFSLKTEQARTNATGWVQKLRDSRKDDLWEVPEFRRYCRPPVARSAGKLPGLVIPFSTETIFGRNFFGKTLAAGDSAFNPTNFANKIAAAGVSFVGYPTTLLSATPQVYLVPAGLDVMTIPNSPSLETRSWSILDQAIPVPFPVGNSDLTNPNWIPVTDGLTGLLGETRRFSSFRAGVTGGAPPLATDTRLVGRSVWNTNWLLIIPGGTMLNDGELALERFITRVTDIKLYLNTYGYSGN